MKSKEYLLKIEQGIIDKNPDAIRKLFSGFSQIDFQPEIVFEALKSGLEKAREQFRAEVFSIPEFLLSIDAFKAGVKSLETCSPGFSKKEGSPVILIGVVEGDVHDLGKNMVASVLGASGYNVVDLGREVTCDRIVSEMIHNTPSLIALSSMMSTSVENMEKIICQVRREYPKIPFLVGGAALDRKIANSIASDGFADNAVTAPEEAARIIGKI